MKVTRIDRRTAKMLSHELEKAATIIAEKYGLKVSKKSGSFDEMRHTARRMQMERVQTRLILTSIVVGMGLSRNTSAKR